MAAPKLPERDVQVKIRNIRSSDFQTLYSNNVAMLSGFFDTNIMFGEVQGIEDGDLVVEQKLKVIMSPAQAKIFCVLLWQQIRGYEDRFGSLEVGPEMVPPELVPFLNLYNELTKEKKP